MIESMVLILVIPNVSGNLSVFDSSAFGHLLTSEMLQGPASIPQKLNVGEPPFPACTLRVRAHDRSDAVYISAFVK